MGDSHSGVLFMVLVPRFTDGVVYGVATTNSDYRRGFSIGVGGTVGRYRTV